MDDGDQHDPTRREAVPHDAELDDIRTRLVGIESRIDSVDRHVLETGNEQRGALEFIRRRAGWILLWSVLGLGSCSNQNSAGDTSARLSEISSRLDSLAQQPAVTNNPAQHVELMELCHLVGQVAGREKVVPKAVSDTMATDCVSQARAGYDAVAKAPATR